METKQEKYVKYTWFEVVKVSVLYQIQSPDCTLNIFYGLLFFSILRSVYCTLQKKRARKATVLKK